MTTLREDPLLGIARAILTFLMGLTIFVGAAIAIVVPVVLLNQDRVLAEFSPSPSTMAGGDVIGAILAVMVLVTGIVVLSALVAAALWLPTVTVPADHSQLAATPVAVELA